MNKDDIPKNLKSQFDNTYWSIYLFNSALSELKLLSVEVFNVSEVAIIKSRTISFYKVTLQYCVILEYTKLFDKLSNNKKENNSSLFKLIYKISLVSASFKNKYEENLKKLNSIKETEFFVKMKAFRDKKFAHSDFDNNNLPFNFKSFSNDDFSQGFCHLEIVKEILDDCSSIFNYHYGLNMPHKDNRTKNFIQNQAKYKDFYRNNHLQK